MAWEYDAERYDASTFPGPLNKRGAEGWEAVGMVLTHIDGCNDPHVLVMFKRPLGEPSNLAP